MNKQNKYEISKTMSLMLRHNPNNELSIKEDGFVSISDLINCKEMKRLETNKKITITEELIYNLVEENKKQRFTINSFGFIRANQGHSILVLKYLFFKYL